MTYEVTFSFTTAHKGSRFVGRGGVLCFETEDNLETVKVNMNSVHNLCVQYVLLKKPSYKIVMLAVEKITALNTKTETV